MPIEMLGIMIPILALMIPIVAIVTAHQRKMAEIRVVGPAGGPGVVEEVRKLQEQVTELRDTTTRYDLSFDAALQRIEGRMTAVEMRVNAIEGKEQARIGTS